MKNIKNILKLALVLPLFFIALTSCDNEKDYEDLLTRTTTTQENSVFIETNDTHEKTVLTSIGEMHNIVVGVNEPLPTDTTVSLQVEKDGVAAVDGVDYVATDATILTNQMTGTATITFITLGDFKVSIGAVSNPALIIAPNYYKYKVAPPLTFSITWANGFYDYDLYLLEGDQDINGNIIAFSNGTTTTESFQAVPPIGRSSLYVLDYWGDNASTPVTLTIDDGVNPPNTFNIVMDMSKFVLTIDTSIDANGNIVYVFTQL